MWERSHNDKHIISWLAVPVKGQPIFSASVFARPHLPVSGRTSVAPEVLHHDELKIDLPLVRALVDPAHPDLAALPLRQLEASGSTNALFRLGDNLLVRLPRQSGGSVAIEKEANWPP
jgi:hypothetical protein